MPKENTVHISLMIAILSWFVFVFINTQAIFPEFPLEIEAVAYSCATQTVVALAIAVAVGYFFDSNFATRYFNIIQKLFLLIVFEPLCILMLCFACGRFPPVALLLLWLCLPDYYWHLRQRSKRSYDTLSNFELVKLYIFTFLLLAFVFMGFADAVIYLQAYLSTEYLTIAFGTILVITICCNVIPFARVRKNLLSHFNNVELAGALTFRILWCMGWIVYIGCPLLRVISIFTLG